MLPDIYKLATVRCVTPCDGQVIGIAFDSANGTGRFRLRKEDAIQLATLILSHSERSSGMPSLEVSSNSPDGD